MNSDETFKRLVATIRDVFGRPNLVVTENTKAADVAGWDSLGQVRLIVALEEEFGIEFEPEEIADLRNVGELHSVLVRLKG